MHTMRVSTSGGTIAAPALPKGVAPYTSSYLHHDQLGSIVAITNNAGVVVERLAYDPWGKRRQVNGTADTLDVITGQYIDRGFTMHEHIDEMGIINMNGRIYDPLIGRFMSADPYIQAPDDLQSHNRYAYVMNNPLNLTDPSGYNWLTKTWKKAWKSPIFRAVLGIVVAIAAPYALTWLAPTLFVASSLPLALATGALSGFASTGTLKGALTGAFTAGIMFGADALAKGLELGAGSAGKIAIQAGAGCLSSVAGGGSCKSGAMAGGLSELGNNWKTDNMVVGTIKSAMIGGAGSKLGGGKFADGAQTGAFSYLMRATPKAYEDTVGYKLDTGPGGDAVVKGENEMPREGANNIGTQGNEKLDPECMACEGGKVSRIANEIYGVNAMSGLHDVFQISLPGISRDILNVPGMPVAAAITYFGLLGDGLNKMPYSFRLITKEKNKAGKTFYDAKVF